MINREVTSQMLSGRKRTRSEVKEITQTHIDSSTKATTLSSRHIKENKKSEKAQKNYKTLNIKQIKITEDNNLDPCTVYEASEEDFMNPIEFFDNLWKETNRSTGIIKIIPPRKWKERNINLFKEHYYNNFARNAKKMETRIQKLSSLIKGKVILQ